MEEVKMELKKIYNPIKSDLKKVDKILEDAFRRTRNNSILKVTDYLLESPGKKIRPALVILSAKAALNHRSPVTNHQLIKIASAVELMHLASIIHDDVIDHANMRHNKRSINARWGEDVSIALGDYLYSMGFELISSYGNPDVLSCISQATKSMCEGELTQVCERDNLDLLERRYIVIVKKKTASLFAASCQAGAILSNCQGPIEDALKGFGLNFGIAFQIIDDYLDLASERDKLGKSPGQDIAVGEMTLPLLNLLESASGDERRKLKKLIESKDKSSLKIIKKMLLNSNVILRTKMIAISYIDQAKAKLKKLPYSEYRKSLFDLADFIITRGFNKRL
ncbi:MAG: polyprenyl synthetase family protein [Candidatus Omnitrophica bacterium]|nr:polyprenyl synthetase family protein [Candidatus Omnitrophota bacterium]